MPFSDHYQQFSAKKMQDIQLFSNKKDEEEKIKVKGFIKKRWDIAAITDTIREKKAPIPSEQETLINDLAFIRRNKEVIALEINTSDIARKLAQGKNFSDVELLYYYHITSMLHAYYLAYRKNAKIAEYASLLSALEESIESGPPLDDAYFGKKSFLRALFSSLYQDLLGILATPLHAADTKNSLGYLNLVRVYWVFARLTISRGLLWAKDALVLDSLANLLGQQIDAEAIIKTLERPNEILRFLSVGFFAGRFLYELALVIKHTFFASEVEAAASRDWMERLKDECWDRHINFFNDIAWGTVNLLASYASYFNLSLATGVSLTGTFLVFDACLLSWRWYLASRDYAIKNAQYASELNFLGNQNAQGSEAFILINKQRAENDLRWQLDCAFFSFNLTGSLFMFSGFTAALLLSPAAATAFCYASCMIASSIYLSGGSYKNYKEQQLRRLQAIETSDIDYAEKNRLQREYSKAQWGFVGTMLENAALPFLFIASVVIYWPAAVLLTVAVLSYELSAAYTQHHHSSLLLAA